MNLFQRLWNDREGAVISGEYLLLGVIVVLGVTVGLASVRYAIISELGDMAAAISGTDYNGTSPEPYPALHEGEAFTAADWLASGN